MSKESYQKLQPLTIEQRVWIAIAALKFFQPIVLVKKSNQPRFASFGP